MVDKYQKVLLSQQEQIDSLLKRVDTLETKLSTHKESFEVEEPEKVEDIPKKVDDSPETPTNWFKIFGGVGLFMIILGVVYFYQYAVDQGWIGITGRIAIGIIAGLMFIVGGQVMYGKKYENFSQILFAGGLAIIYFTLFATYHFEQYRRALGMSLTVNTILLLFVMISGTYIAFKIDKKLIIYGSLGLGYLAAFLSGIEGNTLHILIYVLLIDLIILFVSKMKKWFVSIPAQVLTYIALSIWYFQGIYSPDSIMNQTQSPVLITFGFMMAYYILFTYMSFVQSSVNKEEECLVISIINTIFLAGFGLGIINKYYPDMNGLYLMIVATISLIVGILSKKQNFKEILDIQFLSTVILVALAVPVQFDKTIVTVLWVLMSLGLAYAGIQSNHKKLFLIGYFGYLIPFARVLFFDLWFLNGVERVLSVGITIIGALFMQLYLISKFSDAGIKEDSYFNFYSIVGSIIATLWILVEIFDMNIMSNSKQLLLSISWALFGIAQIIYGVNYKRKIFSRLGIILFGIVVLKILVIDVQELSEIFRVLALIIVGLLALIGSFIFVKNKEKIKKLI